MESKTDFQKLVMKETMMELVSEFNLLTEKEQERLKNRLQTLRESMKEQWMKLILNLPEEDAHGMTEQEMIKTVFSMLEKDDNISALFAEVQELVPLVVR